MPRLTALACLLGAATWAASPIPAAPQLVGSVGPQSRLFFQEPLSSEQSRWHEPSLSLGLRYERALSERLTVSADGFGRLAGDRSQRSHVEPREALLRIFGDDLAAGVGIATVFWGVTESRHLVDIVNQKDYLEGFDGEDKLGQLLALLSYDTGRWGFFELFMMAWFRPLRFPSGGGRPGAPLPVLDDRPGFEGERTRWSADYAVRWSHSVAPFDWALSYFHGTSREPQLLPAGTAEDPVLLPFYELIDQAGLELQWTRGDWLWKAEGMVRGGQGPTFAAATLGFERTTTGVFGNDVDVGLLLEYSHDGRVNRTFNAYDDDIFGGVRVSLNDAAGTEIVAGALTDVGTGVTLGTWEASRRVGERWTVELAASVFLVTDLTDPLHWFRRDDYLQTTIEYYF